MMAVAGISLATLEKLTEEQKNEGKYIQIANYNTPDQIILSGSLEDLKLLSIRFSSENVKTTMLNVSGAFHSKYMLNAVSSLRSVLEPMKVNKLSIPVMNCSEHRFYTEKDDVKELLVRQIVEPVRWYDSIKILEKENIGLWLEFGPKDVLKKLVIGSIPDAKAFSMEKDITEVTEMLNGNRNTGKTHPGLIELCLGAAVATQNRNWNEEEYEEGVIASYRQLQSIYEIYEKSKANTFEEMQRALELLAKIFETKKVSRMEQSQRLAEIIVKTNNYELFPQYLNLQGERL
jgi:[acyl-carrier-protein] S-malonyltransferase